VLDPFMGIGSTAYIALGGETCSHARLAEARNVKGFELKGSYYSSSLKNVERARAQAVGGNSAQMTLADLLPAGEPTR
jgi:hypothetical protein